MKDIIVEVDGRRRTINSGLKVYGTAQDLAELRDAITTALNAGLVQGWVGAGMIDDPKTVFPYNGKDGIPLKDWRSENV